MGMSFENNNLTPAEQKEQERLEKERAAAASGEPSYTSLGCVEFNGKPHLLLVGEDKKWYKCKYLHETQLCESRNSPKVSVWDTDNITPVTKDEFYSYFERK